MEKYYKTDGTNSYIVPDKYNVEIDCFDIRVLQNVTIDNLIGFEFRGINQDRMIYYRINGLEQFVNDIGDGIGYENLRSMLDALLSLIKTLRQYMLRPENLIMDADGIFLERSSHIYKFMYMPDYEQPVNEQIRHLVEQLLKLVDHRDRRAVDMIYDIYDIVSDVGYHIDDISSYLSSFDDRVMAEVKRTEYQSEARQIKAHQDDICQPAVAANYDMPACSMQKNNPGRADLMNIVFNDKTPEPEDDKNKYINSKNLLLTGIVLTGVVGVIFAAMQLGRDGHIEYVKPLMLIVMLMAVLCFIYIQIGRDKQEKNEQDMAYAPVAGCSVSKNIPVDNVRLENTPVADCARPESVPVADCGRPENIPGTNVLRAFGDDTTLLPQTDTYVGGSERRICLTDMSGRKLKEWRDADMPFILGRGADTGSNIMTDQGISRRHARIYRNESRYYIEDMDSTNGTFVNDAEILSGYPFALTDGDRIRLGESGYIIHIS